MDRTTSYGYDADGNLITVTDPMDDTTTYSYTPDNEVLTVTDPTARDHDLWLRPRWRAHLGHRPQRLRDDLLVQQPGPGRRASLSRCRAAGPVDTRSPSRPTRTTPTATCSRRPTATTTPRRYIYNALNEETSVDNGDGDTTHVHLRRRWQRLDRRPTAWATPRRIRITTWAEVLTETQPSGGGTTTYTYDLAGRLDQPRPTRMTISRPTHITMPTRSSPRRARRAD